MTDISVYRPVAPVGGALESRYRENGEEFLQVLLDRDTDSVVMASVNDIPSPEILMIGIRRVACRIPASIKDLPTISLRVSVLAEVSLDDLTEVPVPAVIGLGPRPTVGDEVHTAMQSAVRTLLMSPGSDYDHPERGGGLLLVQDGRFSDLASATRVVTVAVDRTNSYLARSRSASGTTRVLRMELQNIRMIPRVLFEAQAAFRQYAAATVERLSRDTSSERVLAISLRMKVRLPNGQISDFSSSVAR